MTLDLLSPRQQRVARHIAEGMTDAQIAAALEISVDGVAYHVARIAEIWRLDRRRNLRVQIAVAVVRAA